MSEHTQSIDTEPELSAIHPLPDIDRLITELGAAAGAEQEQRRLHLGPPDPEVPCCMTSIYNPDECCCWRPMLAPHPTTAVQTGPAPVREDRCGDCAYRRDSPERIAREGDPLPYDPAHTFYCHEDMPRVWAWVHPSGAVAITPTGPGEGDYRPVLRAGRAWRADGRPALVCAGWAAQNRTARNSHGDNAMPTIDLADGHAPLDQHAEKSAPFYPFPARTEQP